MTIRGIIFDLGSTLMYFDGDWEDVVSRGAANMAALFTRKRVKLDDAALAKIFVTERRAGREVACRTESLRAALEKVEAPPEAIALVPEAVRVYFEPEEAAWKAYPDAKATLKHLFEQGYRLGLLSNATDDAFIQRLVNRLELRPWLSPTFSSAGLGLRKPLREPFELILSRWNLPPASVVMVGDTLDADILGAHKVGMRGILIAADEAASNNDHRGTIIPDATINVLSELPALIESWRA
jgi:putative hydrolase of the HAD superfamily